MYKLWPGQAQFMPILTFIWPPWPWPSTYVKKMFQLALFPLRDKNCAKIILKSMHKCTSYGSDNLNFDLYLASVTLTVNLFKKMFQIALLLLKDNNCAKLFLKPPPGQQLCKIILKSMHYCTSYAPDKLMYLNILTFIWLLWPWTSTYLKCFKW